MRKALLPVVMLGLGLTGCNGGPAASADPAGTVTMVQNQFSVETQQLSVGQQITFSNSGSRIVHILAIGKDGQSRQLPDAPSFGADSRHRSGIGDRWTTPPWNTPGTFHVTCTLHPAMNLTVVVGAR